ncbi:hypothetical protein VTK73DRAFT_2233 [Phialemonium thermophilum]|uniref:Zn(2)-C6 fungal-type domain-containing protein n=1 Tax=Phialemonium thermophilum TaxID=223376 RepID=A0ABR3X684_9PEZI
MPDQAPLSETEVSHAVSDSENDYEDNDKDGTDKMEDRTLASQSMADSNGDVKKKYDPKDPSRPRRKKARRACYACQRAHLTCGDERPCQRCIKRGLAEACQDGVRKKAKYLHDAPPEALGPVLGPGYNRPTPSVQSNRNRHPSSTGSEASSTVGNFFSPRNTSQYSVFPPGQPTMGSLSDGLSFGGGQQSPVSPTFQTPNAPQMSGITVPQVSGDMPNFTPAFFDPSNPAIFNFNLEGLNFGSQYGAMEFGMLGHMSSGAAETPPRDPSVSQQGDVNFGSTGVFGNGGLGQYDGKVYDANVLGDLLNLDPNSNGVYSQGNLQHGLPHAYAIAAGPSSLQSPSTENNSPQPTNLGFEGSPTTATYNTTPGSAAPQTRQKAKSSKLGPQSILGKRHRDPSYIYETVKEPYQYVRSFHKLIAFLQQRFSASKTLRIAKSLASIRPAFISCTRTLNRQDLIFMEKSFQRALFEYEEFMQQCSSPAIVCRRTGEIAGVNKEFTALTGWSKAVLLGQEPNLNVNTGGSSGSSSAGNTGRAGMSTPRLKTLNAEIAATKPADGQPQPVFLAELLDDESVITFYEDYAQLAFNDSRGKVVRKCSLLKYRTQESVNSNSGAGANTDESPQRDPRSSILSNRVARIDGEHGISKLEKDGKLECSYTWTIKRDTFDIPMLIIINFLPCYFRSHNQLAV